MSAPSSGERRTRANAITAGGLRAAGIDIPEDIPDCATLPPGAVTLGPMEFGERPDGTLVVRQTITFLAPFEWITVEAELRD